MESPLIVARDRHDDGIDAWDVARALPGAALAGAVRGYSSYWERTASFTARRVPNSSNSRAVNDAVRSQ